MIVAGMLEIPEKAKSTSNFETSRWKIVDDFKTSHLTSHNISEQHVDWRERSRRAMDIAGNLVAISLGSCSFSENVLVKRRIGRSVFRRRQ